MPHQTFGELGAQCRLDRSINAVILILPVINAAKPFENPFGYDACGQWLERFSKHV